MAFLAALRYWRRARSLWSFRLARSTHALGRGRIEERLAELASTLDGDVGVAAHDLESGLTVGYNEGDVFPMASTAKLPIAIALLAAVAQGEIHLGRLLPLGAADIAPGAGLLSRRLRLGELALPVATLLDLMLTESDNAAADVLLDLLGGPVATSQRLASMGFPHAEVHRSMRDLLAQQEVMSPTAFLSDVRDTTTPIGMVDLLAAVWRGTALDREGAARLARLMSRCSTGPGRLRGLLPTGAVVAHKTGTLKAGLVADVGVITPKGGGAGIAVAVFVRGATIPVRRQEAVIAKVGRIIHDHVEDLRSTGSWMPAGSGPEPESRKAAALS